MLIDKMETELNIEIPFRISEDETKYGNEGYSLKVEKVPAVIVYLLHNTGSWNFLLLDLNCEVSTDGVNYVSIGREDMAIEAMEPGKYLKEVVFTNESKDVRFIRIKAKGMKQNPDWHPSKVGENWIFIDEVVVN